MPRGVYDRTGRTYPLMFDPPLPTLEQVREMYEPLCDCASCVEQRAAAGIHAPRQDVLCLW